MPNSRGVAIRCLIILGGVIAAALISDYLALRVLGFYVSPDAQGNYTVNYLRGDGHGAAVSTFARAGIFVALLALLLAVLYARRPIDRIVRIAGAYVAASAAAGATLLLCVIVVGAARRGWSYESALASPPAKGLIEQAASTLSAVWLATVYVALFALLPALFAIIYTERKGVRSAIFYAAAGAVTGVVSYGLYLLLLISGSLWSMYKAWSASGTGLLANLSISDMLQFAVTWLLVFAVPGLAAGLAYWSLAGRTAGMASMPGGGDASSLLNKIGKDR